MKALISLFLMVALSMPLLAAEKPANLDELLDQVKRERVLEQQQNKLREAEFVEAHDKQAQLLEEARRQLQLEEQRTTQLNQAFNDFEQGLAEQESLLSEKSGSLGELFGTVRQVANDSRGVLESSMTTVHKPERVEFLSKISDSK